MFSEDFDCDIIVIGGGISGLTAALNIVQRDPMLSVMVLEANETVGGRTKPIAMETSSPNKCIQDTGGHFVSRSQSHLMCLLYKLGVDIVDYDFPGETLTETAPDELVRSDGMLLLVGTDTDKDELTTFYRKLEKLCGEVSMENPMSSVDSHFLDAVTMDEYIQENLNSVEARRHVRNIVRTTCGSQPTHISVLFYLAFCNSTGGILGAHMRRSDGGRCSYIKGGISSLVDKLVDELGEQRIFVDQPVVKISRSEWNVVVYTIKEKFKCRCAILAIPPQQTLSMNFDPPLYNRKLDVLERMRGKRWMKFVATYKEPFWEKDSLNGDICVNPKLPTCPAVIVLNVSTKDCTALTGLVDVKRLKAAENHDVEVLMQLERYLGSEALEPLDYIEKHWPEWEIEAPMSSSPVPGIMRNFHEIRRPVGRLYFAGSETATYWYGHIGGAVQTGLRAALEVLYEIRPQVLCYDDFAELKPRTKLVSYFTKATGAPPPTNFDWITRTAGGVAATLGAYMGSEAIVSTYQSVVGYFRRAVTNNATMPT